MVAHLDGATGEAVVELAQKDRLPHVIKLLLWILVRLVFDRRHGSQQLQGPQHIFGPPVIELILGLGGVRSTVQLKVQLAIPCDKFVGLELQPLKEVVNRASHVDSREEPNRVADGTAPAELLKMLPGRAAASVSLAED